MLVLATSALAYALVTGLSATAEARSLHDRLRSCLEPRCSISEPGGNSNALIC
jgi:hypothetical protein